MLQIVIAGMFILIFFLILYFVITKKIDSVDQFIYDKISKLINPNNTKFMKFITGFGSTLGIILSIFISLFFLKNNFNRGFIMLGTLGEAALNSLIKVIIRRPRPAINPLVKETNFSFPSGHTMASTAFYMLILFFIWKSPLPKEIKIVITIFSILIVLGVAFSRIYLGVHYFSDVVAGICCSVAYVLILTYFYPDLSQFFR